MTFIFAILLYVADKVEVKKKLENNINIKSIIIIGLFQVLALIPGVSRSGIVMTGARFLKFNREDAAKISFLMAIPALLASTTYGIFSLINKDSLLLNINSFLTIGLSFVFSYFTIKYLLIYLKKFNFTIIIGYRLILGLILLSIAYL